MATLAPAEKRGVDRLCPRGVVSLSIYQGDGIPPAYAIVSDISDRGACVNSDRILFRGQNVRLRIQFEAERDLFETGGRVAWTRPSEGDEKLYGDALTGIAFELPTQSSGGSRPGSLPSLWWVPATATSMSQERRTRLSLGQ